MTKRIAALFDIDGTLIITGGAGAAAWRLAFEELYGIPADIGEFTDTGMTDPDVGHKTFAAVLGRQPTRTELGKLMERRLHHLYRTVEESDDYRILEGSRSCCHGCWRRDTCSGWSPATWRPPPTSSCTGPGSTGTSPSVAMARTPPTGAS
jgi:beta-phosphoglucomutase-like phosphatase (HAD superfamily)